MYVLGALGRRSPAGVICVAGAVLWGRLVAAAVGVICVAGAVLGAPRGRMYALGSLQLCRCGRRGTWCSPRGRMYVLGSLGCRSPARVICVAGAVLGALQGVGYCY